MVETGDWLTPRLNYVEYFEKPPLFYWLVAIAFRLFGLHPAAGRLVNALSALGGVCLTVWLGRRLFGWRVGFLAGIILATSLEYAALAQVLIIDTPLMFFFTATLACFAVAYFREEGRRATGGYVAAWGAAALATLTKGPMALILPGLILLAFTARTGAWGRLREWAWGPGVGVFLALAAPWFVAMSLRHPEFPAFFFVHEHVLRFFTKVHHRAGPPWYYLPVLGLGFFPWSPFLLAAGRPAWDWRKRREEFFLLAWAGVLLLFFSASGSKLVTYILPIFPPLALLVARRWEEFLEEKGEGRMENGEWKMEDPPFPSPSSPLPPPFSIFHSPFSILPSPFGRGAWAALGGLGGLLAVGVPFLLRSRGAGSGVGGGLVLMEVSLGGGLLLAAWSLRRGLRAACFGALAALSVGFLSGATLVAAALEPLETVRPLAQTIAAHWRPGDRLVAFHSYAQSLNFYTGQRVTVVGQGGELTFGRDHSSDAAFFFTEDADFLRLLRAPGRTWAVARRKDYERVRARLPSGVREWARTPEYVLIVTGES